MHIVERLPHFDQLTMCPDGTIGTVRRQMGFQSGIIEVIDSDGNASQHFWDECKRIDHGQQDEPLEWSALWAVMRLNYACKSAEWTLTTKNMFYEMLEVLPPVAMHSGAFLSSEPWTHNANGQAVYAAFRQLPGKVFQAKYMTANEFRSV